MVGSAAVIPVNIEDEMKESYLDYAMSVIIGRALPDVRDGLKPVHRRILYAMYREGLLPSKRYSKCAGVVGEVLKKYHPHGDAAVYDSLVRMAQEWNLRYTLVDGQGNFGCFTGDTEVRLADGGSRSFEQLVKDNAEGRTHFTYTIKDDGSIATALIKAPRLTKKNAPIVKVTLDNGVAMRCTPDHRFMLRDGTYCEAERLKSGDSLMPFYSRIYDGIDVNLRGYEEVYDPADDRWVFAHHLADEYNILNDTYPKNAGRVRHHKDFNKGTSEKLFVCHPCESRDPVKCIIDWIPAFAGMTNLNLSEIPKLNNDLRRLNHKVVSVKSAGRADVYDLTVDGTHNFALAGGVFVHNSIDGDPAAAYRYTEARMTKISEELLADIDKETIDFIPNYDNSTVEPTVLPTRVPNLLINGSDGIAVGMATKIPPHNLGEVVDGLIQLAEKPEIDIKQLMKLVPGPDFPTGGFITGREGIKSAYETGRGIIKMRARALIEPMAKGDRESIIITEIPYQVNKARLIEHIADLISEGKLEGISDLRDESDREGMRIVVELKKGTISGVILNQLFKHTAMESTFGVILLSLVGGQPKVLTLKEMLVYFLDYRKEVATRRTAFELKKAEDRAHILEGLKIAVENIDEVIALIKKAKSPEIAKEALMKKYELSDLQAQAILDMRLQRLTGLEREKIINEYKEIQTLITELKKILASEKLILNIVVGELKEIREKYVDKRRTEIVGKSDDLSVEDLIQEEDMVVTISHTGYIKRNPISIYRAQRRGGRGKTGMTTGDEDFVEDIFIASTHSYIMIFTDNGKVFWLKVHEIPQAGRATKGKAITNLIRMSSDDKIAAVMPVKTFEEGKSILMATRDGVVKKSDLMDFSNPRPSGIIALSIDEGDSLIGAKLTDGSSEVLLSTRDGQAIRFKEEDVRVMGRSARGVRGISLKKEDKVVSMDVLNHAATILTVTAHGYGKRTETGEYRTQSRGGSGIKTIKVSDRNGPVVMTLQVSDTDDIMVVTDKGKIVRTPVKGIPVIGRATQGVRIVNRGDSDEMVVSIAKLAEKDEEQSSPSEVVASAE